jgi:hypothetical protein
VSVPDGYTVVSESEGNTFVVTNTLTTTTETPTTPNRVTTTTNSKTPHSGTGKAYPLNPQEPPQNTEKSSTTPVDTTPVIPNDDENVTPDIPSETSEETSDKPSLETDNPDSVPDVPPSTTHNTIVNQKLPQTGQLWWPVPVLAFLGLITYMIGRLLRKGQGNEE